jgi:hypothetical protein
LGQARLKKQRFLVEHPICCFCGGTTAATTLDHVPSRACFNGRNGPEGFEFPACGPCQKLLRQEEQFFAFMCHLSDRDNANYDRTMSRRLMQGIKNNLPDLFPQIVQGANNRRRGLRQLGVEKPVGAVLDDVPMVEFPRQIDPVLRKVATKLGLALYYKHKGRPASPSHGIVSYWAQYADQRAMERFGQVISELQFLRRGTRSNFDFGNRFSYAWNIEEPDEPDIFIAVAKFGSGLVTCSMLTEQSAWESDENPSHWITVAEFSSGMISDGIFPISVKSDETAGAIPRVQC